MYKGLIIKTKKSYVKKSGNILIYDKNACILLKYKNKEWLPLGTRIYGCLENKIRKLNYGKVLLLTRGTF